MIKIFRRIRQKLLTQNSFSKYLLYAIGEIILVVIGILIALQINNWNLDQQSIKWEKRFLKDLNNELETNSTRIKQVGLVQRQVGNALVASIDMIESNKFNRDRLDSLYSIVQLSNPTFFPTKAVYLNSLAAGKIETLRNAQLKYQIMNLYNQHFDRIIYNGGILDAVVEKVDWEILSFYNSRKGRFISNRLSDPQLLKLLDYHLEQNQVYLTLIDQNILEIERAIGLIQRSME